MTEVQPILISHRYEQHNLLGVGGMGAVYRATDRLTGQDVALKRVNLPVEFIQPLSSPLESSFASIQLALANEFKVLASLHHPNIISVLDYGFDINRQPYYTMELLQDTQTVLSAAIDQPLDVNIMLIVQVMQALAYLHRHGIIHRDLKPENVLIVNEQAKVLDFGLAVTRELHTGNDNSSRGTLLYMSPEVMDGGVATEASDLYAVGVMAFEMFAGQHPFPIKRMSMDQYVNTVLNERPHVHTLVAPPEIAQIIGRLLEKRPEARFKNAQEVIAALGMASAMPGSNETAAIRESFVKAARFVGRHQEFSRLKEALNEAITGRGSGWLVGGESGVGKSRLLDELRTHALVAGALVLRGNGVEGGGQFYQLWREPIRRLILGSELTDIEAGIIKELVPDIETLLRRDIPNILSLSERASQLRLIATISDLFRRVSEPILLILEDLQWAVESLAPLIILGEFSRELPILIVGTYRNDESPRLPAELPAMQLLRLERLSSTEVAELSSFMLGPIGEQVSLVNLLIQETSGNAFFITEVVRVLAEQAGRLEEIGMIALPHSVTAGGMQAIIRRRLERVPEFARSLLTLAAVAGRQIDRNLLHALDDKVDLDWWLTVCSEAAVLDVQDEQWRFAHDKLRETLLDNLDRGEFARLHKQVAQAIETVFPDDESRSYILFEHWFSAQETEKAARYAEIAGQKMILVGNYRDAISMLERAISRTSSGENQRIRAKLLLLAGNAHFFMGDFSSAIDYFKQGMTQAQQMDYRAEIILLLGRLAGTANEQGNYPEARNYCGQGLEIAQLENDLLNVARLEMLIAVSFTNEGKYQAAEEYLKRSIDYFRESGEKKLLGDALNNLGVIATYRSDFAQARQHWNDALQLSSELSDSHGICISLNNLGGIANELSDFEAGQKYLEKSLEIARKTGDRRVMSLALDNLGVTYQMLGNFDQALAYWHEAITLVRQINYPPVLMDLFQNLGGLHQVMGEYDQASHDFGEAANIAQTTGREREYANALRGLADIACEQGDLESARRYSEKSSYLMRELGNREILVNATWVLGKIAMLEGDYSAALSRYQDSLIMAREIADPGRVAESLASICFVRTRLGQIEEAQRDVVEGLQTALSIKVSSTLLHLLSGVAHIAYARRDFGRSAELCGLCICHQCTSAFIKQIELFPLRTRLGQQLLAEVLSSAETRGAERDLMEVADSALRIT